MNKSLPPMSQVEANRQDETIYFLTHMAWLHLQVIDLQTFQTNILNFFAYFSLHIDMAYLHTF